LLPLTRERLGVAASKANKRKKSAEDEIDSKPVKEDDEDDRERDEDEKDEEDEDEEDEEPKKERTMKKSKPEAGATCAEIMAYLDAEAQRIAFRDGVTKEIAVARALQSDPKLYEAYVRARRKERHREY
jgi:hypothetical protein